MKTGYRIDRVVSKHYEEYAKSTIEDRAIPCAIDGLKPVQRRILYATYEHRTNRFTKSARICGDVTGKYHPHGSLAVYQAAVRMVQNFSYNIPLIDGQGNFGSVDGYPAAADRYTEMKLSSYAKDMFLDFHEFNPMTRNYDDSLWEPVILPVRIPNLLINGSQGIAVGLRTSIPPHNLNEILEALQAMVRNPSISFEEIREIIKGPDFPTGCLVSAPKDIDEFYRKGEGSVEMKARYKIEYNGQLPVLNFYEIPYQTNKSVIVKTISDAVDNGLLPSVKYVRDESDRSGLSICVALKAGFDPNVVANQLYGLCPLKSTFSLCFFALDNEKLPKLYGILDYLQNFISYRKDLIIKRSICFLSKHKQRMHTLIGLHIALERDNLKFIFDLSQSDLDIQEIKDAMLNRTWTAKNLSIYLSDLGISGTDDTCKLTPEQVNDILSLRIHSLVKLEKEKLEKEMGEIKNKIYDLVNIINDSSVQDQVMLSEFAEMAQKHQEPRRSVISGSRGKVNPLDIINPEDVVVIVNHNDCIRRVELTRYRTQNIGGRGRSSFSDAHLSIIGNTKDKILFFSESGRVYSKYIYDIPSGDHNTSGRALINVINLEKHDEKIVNIFALSGKYLTDIKDYSILFCFGNGKIRRNGLSDFAKINQGGKKYLRVESKLVDVLLARNDENIFIATKLGMAIHTSVDQFRVLMSSNSDGVRAGKMKKNDSVIRVIVPLALVMIITSKGYGRISSIEEYRFTSRNAVGVKNSKESSEIRSVGDIVSVVTFNEERDEELLISTEKGNAIRVNVKTIRVTGRRSKGVKICNLEDGDLIKDASLV